MLAFRKDYDPDLRDQDGAEAFAGTRALTNITLPEGIDVIPESAFSSSGLTSVNLPSSVAKIEARAFNTCSSLATVDLSNTKAESIGESAFLNDKAVTYPSFLPP